VCETYCHSTSLLIASGPSLLCVFVFLNDPATTEIYTLSLHDALPISIKRWRVRRQASVWSRSQRWRQLPRRSQRRKRLDTASQRSEEHTSELQSLTNLVCRLLLEKKKNNTIKPDTREQSTETATRQPH